LGPRRLAQRTVPSGLIVRASADDAAFSMFCAGPGGVCWTRRTTTTIFSLDAPVGGAAMATAFGG